MSKSTRRRQGGNKAAAEASALPAEPSPVPADLDVVCDLAAASLDAFYLCGTKKLFNFVKARGGARVVLVAAIFCAFYLAYSFRFYSVQRYGYLIHEFDPWFNFRATQYMSDHGWHAFFSWFDYMSWYPLGRPVGSTTYPGLQITAVAIHRALNNLGMDISLNNVCVLIPAWFGVIATLLLAALTYEISASLTSTALAAASFCVLPAHLMRSMAGEFDNECIALAAMLLTFYLWVRSLRCPRSWPIGVLAGLAYGYMVAAWGGYIFVINMVALHAAVCALNDWAAGRYNPALLRAYALFYIVGTAIATRVPPVGMAPFKSLEQLSALLVLLFLAALEVAERVRARMSDVAVRSRTNLCIRVAVFAVAGVALVGVALLLAPTGYFGPLSSRVRALFVAHTRTGNPLVDSVAEHVGVSISTYIQSLHFLVVPWCIGYALLLMTPARTVDGMLFAVLFNLTTLYFSGRMSRLMVLAGPSACLTSALTVGAASEWAARQLFWTSTGAYLDDAVNRRVQLEAEGGDLLAAHGKRHEDEAASVVVPSVSSLSSSRSAKGETMPSPPPPPKRTVFGMEPRRVLRVYNWTKGTDMAVLILTLGTILGVFIGVASLWIAFASRDSLASPRIVFSATFENGTEGTIDDYYTSYLWLKDNTPADARVLSWWDYGYQIAGIGNRTTLADGNTWNHEHIATIGKMLTSPVAKAHSLVRHMADYVLIWQEDLGKSLHMARIGNSVYRDICPSDPLCHRSWFADHGPTPLCQDSLLFNLVMPHGMRYHHTHPDQRAAVEPVWWSPLFESVYVSEHELVRIYKVVNVSKESKAWIADPANRRCDKPDSWICPGQYPPAEEIQDMLAKRVDFSQLEDFNRKGRKDEYYEAYMAENDN